MIYNKISPVRRLQCMTAGMGREKCWGWGGVILLSMYPESRGAPGVQRSQGWN